MTQAHVNDIQIEFDTFGEAGGRPLLLIMGLGTQMIAWPEAFCETLASKGHYVIRFDNRDCGLSGKMETAGVPDIMAMMSALADGKAVAAPYTLSDMSADAFGLMDAIGLEKAHICGLSMGGMIAQTMAINAPHRVLSLISMASSTGEGVLPEPTPEAMAAMFALPPQGREANIAHRTEVFRVFSGGSNQFDPEMEQEISRISWDRCFYPDGFTRQFAAILASGDRKAALEALKAPTLVIHGTHDPLALPEHGRATAEAIPGAKLMEVAGLGHGLSYPGLWEAIIDAISGHTLHAEEQRSNK